LKCGANGSRYILTVAGRGYRFVAPVSKPVEPVESARELTSGLPARLTSVVGRDDEVRRLQAQMRECRLITITGGGGVGKTTLGVEAARGLLDDYPGGVHLVDFGPVSEQALVPTHLAATLGFANVVEDPTERVVAALQDRRMLLLLDGCEHVLVAVATLAESLLKGAPGIDLIATSREPLKAEGEGVFRLSSLATPSEEDALDEDHAQSYSAVQLFLERSSGAVMHRPKETHDLSIVAEICRRLDGNALAIEIAAGQLETFGLRGLVDLLDDHFLLLMQGRRTADRRHQTLGDTLDWSYKLLPTDEQWLLRQLSVSVGVMSLQSCCAIAGPSPEPGAVIADLVSKLVAKSLMAAEVGSDGARFRLLDVTRAYALARLREAGEYQVAIHRLSVHVLNMLARPDLRCLGVAPNLRVVLDWAHSPDGNREIALRLTSAAIPYWFSVGLIEECRIRIEQALAVAKTVPSLQQETMELQFGLAGVLVNTIGAGAQLAALANEIRTRAEQLGDVDFRLRALWALWVEHTNSGMHAEALVVAQQFADVAAGPDPSAYEIAAQRMLGISLHYTGDQQAALVHLDRVLAAFNMPEQSARNIPFQFDQRVSALCYRARVLHVLGFHEQAMKVASDSVAEAQALGHLPSLAYTLCEGALPIAINIGNARVAEAYVRLALDSSRDPGLDLWQKIARSFEEWLWFRHGEVGESNTALRVALIAMRSVRFDPIYTLALARFAEALGRSGALVEAFGAIEQAITRADQGGELWCRAELLRIKADLLMCKHGSSSRDEALSLLHEARDEARARSELCWELRIAISLIRLGEPTQELEAALQRSTEGFGTDDFVTALNLLSRPDPNSQHGRSRSS
jgi:predicted ATPase